jgi:tetratricopeptide (TPR) repeat protein
LAENDSPHLTDGQILALADTGGDAAALRHAGSCDACRNRLAHWREARALVASAGSALPPAQACPPAEELANYAAGALPPDRTDAILAHLVNCPDCSAILADSVAPEPAALPRPIPLQASVTPRRRAWAPLWKYAVAAGVLLAVGAGVTLWSLRRSNQTADLLAQAYTQARPFDYRLPDAGYAPIRQQRGAGSAFDRPEALTTAIAAIRRTLDAHPQSAAALVLKGRAELLDHDYESAIDSLTRATEADPRDADALADLGAAYAVRGESENRETDYGHAIELSLRALRQRPGAPRILFNLALTYEKLSMVDEAIDTWRSFLRGNPAAGWRSEAEQRLEWAGSRK